MMKFTTVSKGNHNWQNLDMLIVIEFYSQNLVKSDEIYHNLARLFIIIHEKRGQMVWLMQRY